MKTLLPRVDARGETLGLALTIAVLLACGLGPSWNYKRLVRDPAEGDLVSVSCEDDQAACYEGAARACPQGFAIADYGGHTEAKVIPVYNSFNKQTTYYAKEDYNGAMLVRCKPTAPPPSPIVARAEAPPPSQCVRPGGACQADEHCCEGHSCVDTGDGRAVCLRD